VQQGECSKAARCIYVYLASACNQLQELAVGEEGRVQQKQQQQ
jgi:hypothetical protein